MKTVILFAISVFVSVSAMAGDSLRCLYIANKTGAAVYNQPTLYPPGFKFTLPYGTLVKVEEFTAKHETVVSGNKDTTAQWLKISIPDSNLTGLYLLDVNIHPFLKEIPADYLADYNFLNLKDSFFIEKSTTYYNSLFQTKYGNMKYTADSSLCGCYSYGKNPQLPSGVKNLKYPYVYFIKNDSFSEIPDKSPVLDTLTNLIAVTIIDINDFNNKRIKNKYAIDTAGIWDYYKKISGDREFYYVLLNEGKDSLLIDLTPGESEGGQESFAGEIKPFNSYIFQLESFYHQQTFLINKTTGKRTVFTEGLPNISPSGKFITDIINPYDYELNEVYGASLTVSTTDDSLHVKKKIYVQFRSFLISETYTPFWVSNNELIIKVYPIDNFIYNQCTGSGEANYQYLKIKILKY